MIIALIALSLPAVVVSADNNEDPGVVIAEFRVSGDPIVVEGLGDVGDYVSIFNNTDSNLDLTGYRIEYASSANADSINCAANGIWDVPPLQTVELSGVLASRTLSLPVQIEMAGNLSGSLRIIGSAGTVHDLVGWGSTAPCKESEPTERPNNGNSSKRYIDCSGDLLIDTDNNANDFMPPNLPSPAILTDIKPDSCNDTEDPEGDPIGGGIDGPDTPDVASKCEGVIINELLPNPKGSDNGNEFIELYNPTSASIALKNCKLQIDSNNKVYIMDNVSLPAGGYLALYDETSNLTMPNSAGGSVWLLSHDDVELDQIDYPPDLGDDVAFARFTSGWKQTYTPTPGAKNILQSSKPCPAGQIRNEETGRCRNSVIASALLKPCEPGKERNPLTNRCRSTASAVSMLKPCGVDQFRNPETNRCKKIGETGGLKPCKSGQERNPETNRCRKITGSSQIGTNTDVKDIPAPSISRSISWWFAGASVAGAVGFGLFEWRKEFLLGMSNLKNKFVTSTD